MEPIEDFDITETSDYYLCTVAAMEIFGRATDLLLEQESTMAGFLIKHKETFIMMLKTLSDEQIMKKDAELTESVDIYQVLLKYTNMVRKNRFVFEQ